MKTCLILLSLVSAGLCAAVDVGVELPCLPCPTTVAPVCGLSAKDGHRTFPSECLLNHAVTCNHYDFKKIHDGACTETDLKVDDHPTQEEGKVDKDTMLCMTPCPITVEPLCAFSPTLGLKSFPNTCMFQLATRCDKLDYRLLHMGQCGVPDKLVSN